MLNKINLLNKLNNFSNLKSFNKLSYFAISTLNTYCSPQECHEFFQNNKQKTKFLDFRPYSEFQYSHLPNAIYFYEHLNILKQFRDSYEENNHDFSKLAEKMEKILVKIGINRGDQLVVYENSMKMSYNTQLFYFLVGRIMNHGGGVAILNGGVDGWEYADFQTESCYEKLASISCFGGENLGAVGNVKLGSENVYCQEREAFQNRELVGEGDFQMQLSTDILIDSRELKELLERKHQDECAQLSKLKIIDVRYEKEYQKAHIPYSINVPLQKLMTVCPLEGIKFKGEQNVKQILKENNINEDDDIIVYCNKGYRATVFYTELQNAGYKKVKNYVGSFYDWQVYLYSEYQKNKSQPKLKAN